MPMDFFETPRYTLANAALPRLNILQPWYNAPQEHGIRVLPSPIYVPMVWNDGMVPFKVTSEGFQKPTFAAIQIQKWPNNPFFTMRIDNTFGSLPSLFSQGVMYVTVEFTLGPYDFQPVTASFEVMDTATTYREWILIAPPELMEKLFEDRECDEVYNAFFKVDVFWKFALIFLSSTSYFTPSDKVIVYAEPRIGYFRISKLLLAACSPHFQALFATNPATTEITPYMDENMPIGEFTLHAFYEYIYGCGLKRPITDCSVALDLLKVGHYNVLTNMEQTMQTLLLAQPPSWYDVKTSFSLYCYARRISATIVCREKRAVWENLMWKALRNLQSSTFDQLMRYEEIADYFKDPESFEMFKTHIITA